MPPTRLSRNPTGGLREDRNVRRGVLIFGLLAALSAATALAETPVVVELFTSEGCSSCPPADRLLRELHRKQPVRGVEIIVLSEHVDYWNRLGWVDPFSDKQFSRRQDWYSTRWPLRLYTPQAVIDGEVERVGSEAGLILEAVRTLSKRKKGLAHVRIVDGKAAVRISDLPRSQGADVLLAVLEDGLETEVLRGENKGRTLAHTAVVRQLRTVGEVEPGGTEWAADVPIMLEPGWAEENLRLAVLVQERGSRRIIGAATTGPSVPATD